jgi:hypothetical protein
LREISKRDLHENRKWRKVYKPLNIEKRKRKEIEGKRVNNESKS